MIVLLAWWLVIGIFPAAITKAYPHALRILPTAPVFLVIVSIGLLQSFFWLKGRVTGKTLMASSALVLIGLLTFWGSYWRYYTKVYAVQSEADWQFGYKEMVAQLNASMQKHPDLDVYVTREYGRPAMYYWFYSKTDPREVQAANSTAAKDQGEFLEFKNIHFVNSVNEAKPGIIVSSLKGFEQLSNSSSIQKLSEIRDDRGQVVWVLSLFAPSPKAQ